MHAPELLDHFRNPRNVGELLPPAITVEVTNPACGDILRLSALVESGSFVAVKFKTRGCTASIAASSALTEMLTASSVATAKRLSINEIEAAVGELPSESKHAAALCIAAVRALVARAS